jgi:hypothetical protein
LLATPPIYLWLSHHFCYFNLFNLHYLLSLLSLLVKTHPKK